MILNAMKTDTVFRVEGKNLNQEKIPDKKLGFLKYKNGYSIFIENKLYRIEILEKNKLNEIDFFFFNRNNIGIVNIIESVRDDIFTMEIIFFTFPIQEIFTPFYIALDEKILETAIKRRMIHYKGDVNMLGKRLKEKMSFTINGESYFLASTAVSSENEIFSEEFLKIGQNQKKIERNQNLSDEDKEECIRENEEELQGIKYQKKDLAFSIHGENIHLPVKKEITQSGQYRFNATKLISFGSCIQKDSLRLIKGDLEFKNGLVSQKIAKDLGDIVEAEGSYLNTWDKYLEEEGKILLEKAKKIGVLKVINNNRTSDGYDLKIENFEEVEEFLNEGDFLSFVENIPSYITDDLTWMEHMHQKEEQATLGIKSGNSESFKIKKIEHGFVTIETDKNITNLESKKIILSIYGDEIQLQRKFKARKRLLEGRSANPLLGLIIEDTDNIKKYQKTTKIKRLEPLTQDIQEKIFPTNKPTSNQIEAIDIALNTPDIAIIQGPPGTGKTTVLNAIIERLNQESDKENMRGQVLVAGFQHDAVENIIQRLDINGIPTPKFGKKSDTIVDIDSYEKIMEWSSGIVNNLKEKSTELTNQLKINKLNQYFEVYLKTPSKQMAVDLLKYIINELNVYLDDDITNRSKEILQSLDSKKIDAINELRYIYALRTTKKAFLDDGIERSLVLLQSSIGKLLDENERKILQETQIQDIEKHLKNIEKLKTSLIDRLYPKPIFRAEKPNEEIIELKEMVEKQLSSGSSVKDKFNIILSDYINEIECNPFSLRSLIEEYSYVYSSTTGQSSKAVKEKIGQDKANEDNASFETLIIDEAARVAPMDLLIAMVLAKKRIILVGDHRQLPHMIDDDIVKNSDLNENTFIKESMFGYLKNRALKLEEYDNIKRAITLENQYRTHPVLGEFVSKNFYEKHNEGFNSPLGQTIGNVDSFFKQELKEIKNIPAVWIDVPNREGREERAWKRRCEAKKIIKYLRKWIFSTEGNELSFGIITFYRNQVVELEKLLKQEFSKKERESFHNRLKIGTVDSFQGMEFDIVFLSIVRSRDVKKINESLKNYNLFGFLISKNRLCVSMSRQKKSLVVVGDQEFFNSERAKQDVEELYNFLQLCKNEGIVL